MKPRKVLVLGSGATRIGQAGEFDYSGSQALKALKEEGVYTVLINPNIATIQTDEQMADQIYFLPVTPYFVKKVIKKEKVDAILLGFGGQTALNCGLELEAKGILSKYGVQVLGTPVKSIRDTEDRHLFVECLAEINVQTANSKAVYSPNEALKAAEEIGYPVMLRAGFALGGKGSLIVNNPEECLRQVEMVFSTSPQILVEECLKGWKEIEYEVVRDSQNNCIIVCNMENVDPMGVHTGESIVVAPSQTLDDYEYQMLRDVAIKTIRHLGIIGECNIQYALDPKSRQYRVIEVNARLSRSSALASKATGYPLAYVATKIALGYSLPEIANSITKKTTAFFEPALDYIVCKFPRWDLNKFDNVDQQIGTEMKSVGEVMAIGCSFSEVIQKAIRMLEIGADGLASEQFEFDDIREAIRIPTPKRIFAIAQAFSQGMRVEEVAELSQIDPFFLHEMAQIISVEQELKKITNLKNIDNNYMKSIKSSGFSDKAIGRLLKVSENEVRLWRQKLGIRPVLSQIDTLAAEYPAQTNFLYFTYARSQSDLNKSIRKKILVLGSGCYRIGASVEFDWCAVSAVRAVRDLGYETIMLNYNPETVSTDYDICEKLVFDEISLEIILELWAIEEPEAVIVSVGGQTANNLALKLAAESIKILGTTAESIDTAEDRNKFSRLLDTLNISQPRWAKVESKTNLDEAVKAVGDFPILVRPSYVLSGAAMNVAYSKEDSQFFLSKAQDVSQDYPVVISKYELNAREIEFDAIAQAGEIKLFAICEHIENAGVHSGDATLVIPPQSISSNISNEIKNIADQIANQLQITGPFNLQLLVKGNVVKVIECNLRVSRSFPLVSKAMGINFVYEAVHFMLDQTRLININMSLDYVVVKAPKFSFDRLRGADPILDVEMSSTGEVACFGRDHEEALLLAMISTGFKLPKKGVLIVAVDEPFQFTDEAIKLINLTLPLYADKNMADLFITSGINCFKLNDSDLQRENLLKFFTDKIVDLVISIPNSSRLKCGFEIRRLAIDLGIPLITDLHLAKAVINALSRYKCSELGIKSLQDYRNKNKDRVKQNLINLQAMNY